MRSGLHDSDAWSLYSVLHSLKCELKLLVFNVFTSSLTANWQWKTPVCETRQEETRTLFIPHTEKKTLKMTRVLMRHCQGGVSHVARLNFKTSRVGVYKRLSLIVGFATTVAICWRRMSLVAISFYAKSLLFGPCRLSEFTLAGPHLCKVQAT